MPTCFAKATAGKWMDPLPRPGKESGAYMNGSAYDVHPYLLLNLGDKYDGLTTYAHEWGHAMHTLLANKAQPFEKADYPTFTAEIASTCNELLLADYMVAQGQDQAGEALLPRPADGEHPRHLLPPGDVRRVRAGHPRHGRSGRGAVGREVHRDLSRPAQALSRAEGRGVRRLCVEWAYIPHFYFGFYVYQYATSISAASYFARSILKGGAKERDNYLSVLKAGGSDYPVRHPQARRPRYGAPGAVPGDRRDVQGHARPGRGADRVIELPWR